MLDLRLLFVAVVWGVNFSVIKHALTDFHPLGFTVIRFLLAALFLFAVMAATGETLAVERKDRWPLVRLGFVGITVYNILFMVGLKYTSASHSALLISLSPLAAVLQQAVRGKERLTGPILLGIGLATSGVIMIIRSRHGAFGFSPGQIWGDLLTLSATVAWAWYTLASRPLLANYPPITVTAYTVAAGGILLIPAGIPDLIRQDWSALPVFSWLSLAFAAFIAAGVAYSLWYEGVKRLGVNRTIVYHYLMPFAAVLFAAFFLREKITLLQVLGGILVLAGVAVVQRKKSS